MVFYAENDVYFLRIDDISLKHSKIIVYVVFRIVPRLITDFHKLIKIVWNRQAF